MMFEITIEINSNEDIWLILDKKMNSIFIHKFNPNNTIEWWKTDLKIKNGSTFKNISVRELVCDIQTDLDGLKQILELTTNQLRIYQFEKKIADSLIIENIPEKSRFEILKQNGLRHFFFLDFEFLTISSFDINFINRIKKNQDFENRMKNH